MLHDIKFAAAVVATILAITAYAPYLVDMFKGKNKPHLYTWISIVLVTATVGIIQLRGGAGAGAIPTILGAIIDIVILFYCFRFGTRDVVFTDKVCLIASIVGVLFYIVFNGRPLLSLAIVTAAEVISFLPTFRKTRNDPYSESLPSYFLLILKLGLILVALREYNALTVSYSAIWIAIFIPFLVAVYSWRAGKPPASPSKKQESALPV